MTKLLCSILIIIVISPLQATTTRLKSMGNLQIAIDDNTNKIDLFNFGNNPCGLFCNEDTSVVDFDILYGEESSKTDTITGDTTYTTFGNAIPYDLLEFIPTYSSAFFQYLPFPALPVNRLFYVKRSKSEKPDIWGNIPKKQAVGFLVTYGRLNQKFSDGKESAGGPTIALIYDKLISPNLHLGFEGGYIYTGYNGDQEFEKATLSDINLTPAVAFVPNPSITIGAKVDYHHPSVTFGTGDNELSYSGNAVNFSLSTIGNFINYLEVGALVGYKILSAKEENDNFSLKGLDVRLRPRYSLPNLPLAIGGLIDIKKSAMLNSSENGDTIYQNEYSRMIFGGGPVLNMKHFLLGFEYIFSTLNEKERFIDRDSTKTFTNTFRIGGEIRPYNFLNLRGGYEFAKEKEREPNNREIVSKTIGTGFGVLLRNFVFDTCYNRIEKEEVDIKKTIKDNLYIISIRYIY